MPGVDFTITPVSEFCPDRATAELMTLTAKEHLINGFGIADIAA
jgi:hypothetical protein